VGRAAVETFRGVNTASERQQVLVAASLALLALVACTACTASISDPSGNAAAIAGSGPALNPSGAAGLGSAAAADPASLPGISQLRRLTLLEYRNSIRDLLGVAEVDTSDLATDQQAGTSGYTAGAAITSAPDVRLFLEHAEKLAAAGLPNLANQVACLNQADAAQPCAREFIVQFGRRAFRRPLLDEEITRLVALYDAQRAPAIGATFSDAIRAVTMAILQSPSFFYHRELAPGAALKEGALVRFNSHEMASRLSYSLWASMPDAHLFQLADTGELQNVAAVQREARRMLLDPKAKDAYGDFAAQWLNLEPVVFAQKVPDLKFTPEVGKAMLAETREFVADILMAPNTTGRLDLMFTSNRSFVDETLAGIYGLSGVTGKTLQPVSLDPKQRAGILTQLSFLTRHGDSLGSFPVRRGSQLVKDVLCRAMPPPPANVPPLDDTKTAASATTRQRFEAHTQNPCATCHKLFDAFGFAFENYDGIGRYRTTDNGQPVNASGTVQLNAVATSFKDAIELMPALASSDEVRSCVATQWLRYVLRRQETAGDMPSVDAVQKAFRDSSFDLRELVVAIVSSDAFARRTPAVGEVLP
jgi:Protein of unknown function (DUF1592)/Protein of unknown function (DUF1588)/Protein of unknown function (DUF1595)/Protein of unknown function (DUF1585)/Protein of unknown function (DUF1587)